MEKRTIREKYAFVQMLSDAEMVYHQAKYDLELSLLADLEGIKKEYNLTSQAVANLAKVRRYEVDKITKKNIKNMSLLELAKIGAAFHKIVKIELLDVDEYFDKRRTDIEEKPYLSPVDKVNRRMLDEINAANKAAKEAKEQAIAAPVGGRPPGRPKNKTKEEQAAEDKKRLEAYLVAQGFSPVLHETVKNYLRSRAVDGTGFTSAFNWWPPHLKSYNLLVWEGKILGHIPQSSLASCKLERVDFETPFSDDPKPYGDEVGMLDRQLWRELEPRLEQIKVHKVTGAPIVDYTKPVVDGVAE